jgi:hypothetical protein
MPILWHLVLPGPMPGHQMLQGVPDFPDLAALNVWLEVRCLELWRETPHGKQPGTIADVWAEEQAALMPLPGALGLLGCGLAEGTLDLKSAPGSALPAVR